MGRATQTWRGGGDCVQKFWQENITNTLLREHLYEIVKVWDAL